MYYEFYILQTASLSSTTRDPSRYSEARDKGRGVGVCARVKWKGKRRGFESEKEISPGHSEVGNDAVALVSAPR